MYFMITLFVIIPLIILIITDKLCAKESKRKDVYFDIATVNKLIIIFLIGFICSCVLIITNGISCSIYAYLTSGSLWGAIFDLYYICFIIKYGRNQRFIYDFYSPTGELVLHKRQTRGSYGISVRALDTINSLNSEALERYALQHDKEKKNIRKITCDFDIPSYSAVSKFKVDDRVLHINSSEERRGVAYESEALYGHKYFEDLEDDFSASREDCELLLRWIMGEIE